MKHQPGLPVRTTFFFFNFERQGKGESKRRRDTSICERCTNRLPLACLQLGIWPTTQACALPGNLTSNLSVCRPALNPLSHTTQRITFTIQKEAVFFYYSMRLKANLKELWFSPIKSSVDIVPLSRLLTNITHFKFPPFTHGGFSFKWHRPQLTLTNPAVSTVMLLRLFTWRKSGVLPRPPCQSVTASTS